MAFHRIPDSFGHDQTDPRAGSVRPVVQRMHHHIGLDCTRATTDGGTELRGPPHPVSSRKHRARSRLRTAKSRSECATALATTVGDDGAAGAGAHAQPEPMHARTAAVVGLVGPLALGHGNLSLFHLAPALVDTEMSSKTVTVQARFKLVRRALLTGAFSVKLPGAAVSPRAGDCSRVLMRFPSVKPAPTRIVGLHPMLQNCWHIERKLLASGNAVPRTDRPGQSNEDVGPASPFRTVTYPALTASKQTTERRRLSFLHKLWINMWTVRHRSFWSSPGRPSSTSKGETVVDS